MELVKGRAHRLLRPGHNRVYHKWIKRTKTSHLDMKTLHRLIISDEAQDDPFGVLHLGDKASLAKAQPDTYGHRVQSQHQVDNHVLTRACCEMILIVHVEFWR